MSSSRQQPALAQGSLTPSRTHYAICFDEGPGYLLIDYLADGADSTAMRVLSLSDNQVYVRKIHTPYVTNSPNSPADFRCPDEKNAIQHSNVPKLISSRYYHGSLRRNGTDPRGQPTSTLTRYVTPATTWQFCNNDSLNNLRRRWEYFPNDSIPEAVLWRFVLRMLEVLVSMNIQGIVHRDVHGGNVLVHFPSSSTPLPELLLNDFGDSERFPKIADAYFQLPWAGRFDDRGRAISNILDATAKNSLRMWYETAVQDMKDMVALLFALIGKETRPNLDPFLTPAEKAETRFRASISSNQGIGEYSLDLVKAVTAWADTLRDYQRPSELMVTLLNLQDAIRDFADPLIQQFIAQGHRAAELTQWMRIQPHTSRPALWSDPTSLFTLVPQFSFIYKEPIRRYLDMVGPDVVVEGGLDFVEVSGGSISKKFELRQGQFEVVEVFWDDADLRYRIRRVVASAHEINHPSPNPRHIPSQPQTTPQPAPQQQQVPAQDRPTTPPPPPLPQGNTLPQPPPPPSPPRHHNWHIPPYPPTFVVERPLRRLTEAMERLTLDTPRPRRQSPPDPRPPRPIPQSPTPAPRNRATRPPSDVVMLDEEDLDE